MGHLLNLDQRTGDLVDTPDLFLEPALRRPRANRLYSLQRYQQPTELTEISPGTFYSVALPLDNSQRDAHGPRAVQL